MMTGIPDGLNKPTLLTLVKKSKPDYVTGTYSDEANTVWAEDC